jgi:hypothetical protein
MRSLRGIFARFELNASRIEVWIVLHLIPRWLVLEKLNKQLRNSPFGYCVRSSVHYRLFSSSSLRTSLVLPVDQCQYLSDFASTPT